MHNQYNPAGITVGANQIANGQCDAAGNLLVSFSSTGKNLTASGLVKTGPGVLNGVIISSQTSGTIKFWDNTAAAAPVLVDTITFTASDRYINLGGLRFSTGLYATIGGTANVVVLYN